MGDPLSVAASVAGLVSLGIQVTQSLVDFYQAYSAQDTDLAKIAKRLESLQDIFRSLERTLAARKFESGERDLVERVEKCIQDCEELILELRNESQNLIQSASGSFKVTLKTFSRRVAYPFRQSTLQKLDEDIGDLRANLSVALEVLQVEGTGVIQDDLEEIKSLLALVRASQISNEIHAWLNAPDATINYHDACNKRYAATGLWLTSGVAYRSWLSSPNSFLWLSGFAGCGKSVLSSTAIQHVFRHRRANPRVAVAFFYFRFDDNSKQGVSSLVRALLLQLSGQSLECRMHLESLRKSHNNSLPPVSPMLETLRCMLRTFKGVYIVIDALDETPKRAGRGEVLGAINQMRHWSLSTLHLLVTSRNEPDILEALDVTTEENISMKNGGVDEDISNFISGHLENSSTLRKWSPYHERIKNALTDGAKGV